MKRITALLPLLLKISKYAIGGAIAAGVDLLFLYIFTDIVGIYYVYSQVFSFVISFFVGFFLQKYVTFQNKHKQYFMQMVWFLIFQLIWLIINLFVLTWAVEHLWVHYMRGSVIAKAVVFVRNFVMNYFFNFKQAWKNSP